MRHNKPSTQATEVAIVGSMTAAMEARRALSQAAIRVEILSAATEQSRGCGYALAYPASQGGNVRSVLQAARIYVKRYTDRSLY